MDDAVAALRKGEAYETARLGLFEAGWRSAPDGTRTPEERCTGYPEICAAYPETDMCAGTGVAPCNFRFTKPDGTALTVSTAGEPLAGKSVTGWRVGNP